MKWIEVKIYTTRTGVEPITGRLMELGINGFEIEDDDDIKEFLQESSIYWDYFDEEILNKEKQETRVKVYISDNIYGEEILLNIKSNLENLKSIESQINIELGSLNTEITRDLNEEEWINKWKEFYKPFNLGEKVLIKPIWEEAQPENGRVVFNINPGHVFGTGLHQTTQLCIVNLEKYIDKNSIVLDLGCGSGILSIISLLLGAKSATAIDIDHNAVDVAYENASLNGIGKDKYFVTSGNIVKDENIKKEISSKKYDIVLANIIADVICDISSFIPEVLKEDGVFIASGIIKGRIDDVCEALKQNKMTVKEVLHKDEWVCIIAKLSKSEI